MFMALTISVLTAGSVYLMLQRGLVRIILGMTLFSHAANLTLMASGVSAWRGEPFIEARDLTQAMDPLPPAFVLTAVVISMVSTTIMLAMAALGYNDDTTDHDHLEGPGIDDGTPNVHETKDPFSTLGRDSNRSDLDQPDLVEPASRLHAVRGGAHGGESSRAYSNRKAGE